MTYGDAFDINYWPRLLLLVYLNTASARTVALLYCSTYFWDELPVASIMATASYPVCLYGVGAATKISV